MISYKENIFKIDTKNTSYIIRISPFKHVLNDYYGAKIEDFENLGDEVCEDLSVSFPEFVDEFNSDYD